MLDCLISKLLKNPREVELNSDQFMVISSDNKFTQIIR